jgi:hypothetical protein
MRAEFGTDGCMGIDTGTLSHTHTRTPTTNNNDSDNNNNKRTFVRRKQSHGHESHHANARLPMIAIVLTIINAFAHDDDLDS